jgi:hypothetical protein
MRSQASFPGSRAVVGLRASLVRRAVHPCDDEVSLLASLCTIAVSARARSLSCYVVASYADSDIAHKKLHIRARAIDAGRRRGASVSTERRDVAF